MNGVPAACVVSGRPFIGGDKIIAGTFLDVSDLDLLGQVSGFPLEHLPNEACDFRGAGIVGQARLIPRQHRGSVARNPIQKE
jgi:hypothetical protein